MKVVGWVLGLCALGGLIVLSVAGVTAAIGVLVTAVAIFAMIVLGGLMGGRNTPDRPPYRPHDRSGDAATEDAAGDTTAAAGDATDATGEADTTDVRHFDQGTADRQAEER